MESYTFIVSENIEKRIQQKNLEKSKEWQKILKSYKEYFNVANANYNYIIGKHNIVFASKQQEGTIAVTSWEEIDKPLKLTPLFSNFLGDKIQLLARDSNFQYIITLTDIDYWFYFAIPPGCDKDKELRRIFDESIIQKFIISKYPNLKITEEKIIDAESFQFDIPHSFYKITGNLYDIINLLKRTKEIKYRANMYFTQHIPQQILGTKESPLVAAYIDFYETYIHKEQLKGIDKLCYEALRYPLRQFSQDLTAIQLKYNLNFQDTLLFQGYADNGQLPSYHNEKTTIKNISVNIKNVKQAKTSELIESLQYYQTVMYDIENLVVNKDQETFTMWRKVIQQVINYGDPNLKKLVKLLSMVTNKEIQPDIYKGKLSLNTKKNNDTVVQEYEIVDNTDNLLTNTGKSDDQKNFDGSCCDQNEIVCISFIVSDFNGKILKRIAVVRSAYEINENADEVIVTHSEKELLEATIQILGCKDYNIIMQFNGWSFDNKQLARRTLMHGLFDDFVEALDFNNDFSWRNFVYNGQLKISGSEARYNLCQIKNPMRFCFDMFAINLKMSPDIDKLESNGLNALLAYYGLGSKYEGVSYQDITDRFLKLQSYEEKYKKEIEKLQESQGAEK